MAKKPTTAKSAETSVLSAAGNSVEKTTAKPAPKKATKAKHKAAALYADLHD